MRQAATLPTHKSLHLDKCILDRGGGRWTDTICLQTLELFWSLVYFSIVFMVFMAKYKLAVVESGVGPLYLLCGTFSL